jgi:hypothetical protein
LLSWFFEASSFFDFLNPISAEKTYCFTNTAFFNTVFLEHNQNKNQNMKCLQRLDLKNQKMMMPQKTTITND